MNREEAYLFLTDLLCECVPKGQVERVGNFYTKDVVGHFRDEEFYFEDLEKRIELLGKNIEKHSIEIIDFMLFDSFIMVASRQSWRNKTDKKIIELVMSVVYRMRDNKICELWVISDTPLESFAKVNQNFPKSMQPLAIDEKDKASFIRQVKYVFKHHQWPKLSQREQDCLYYYLNGFSAKEIAKSMDLSTRTVEDYLRNVKGKCGCSSKVELRKKLFP
ncbi:MAG: helix-turn-helix transcriptional regulator [Gammaproteobacteria bacterium]|jgi:DNA-binding CsgD family transcriptional regulator|nr:helix-turn-helix transcriptional regulator [Gammaproteobacteria bacterium]